jgi:hypothetical protein
MIGRVSKIRIFKLVLNKKLLSLKWPCSSLFGTKSTLVVVVVES